MSLKSATPNLFVDDVAATVDWYRDVLGFKFGVGVLAGTQEPAFEATGQPLGFAMLSRDGVELMFQSRESLEADLPGTTPGTGDVVALYIDVEDVDALHAQLVDKVDIAVDLRDTFYGAREFHFRDCNGLLVGFAQRPRR
jgi:uncharacterized glyoxalase superfamily protein PhnB